MSMREYPARIENEASVASHQSQRTLPLLVPLVMISKLGFLNSRLSASNTIDIRPFDFYLSMKI